MPSQRVSAAERLRRLEEAKAFLQAHLAAEPQPARTLLKAARLAGIATRTLHRAKDRWASGPNALEAMARMGSGRGIRQR